MGDNKQRVILTRNNPEEYERGQQMGRFGGRRYVETLIILDVENV